MSAVVLPSASQLAVVKREFYKQGVAPAGSLFLTLFVDVQQDRLECEIKGWGRDGQSWSVGADVIPGDTAQQAVWDTLHAVIQQDYAHANGGKLPLWAVGIDSGYASHCWRVIGGLAGAGTGAARKPSPHPPSVPVQLPS